MRKVFQDGILQVTCMRHCVVSLLAFLPGVLLLPVAGLPLRQATKIEVLHKSHSVEKTLVIHHRSSGIHRHHRPKVMAASKPVLVPPPPKGLVGTAVPNGASLVWMPVPGAISYLIYTSTVAGGETTDLAPAHSVLTSYIVTGLADHTMDYFKVVAVVSGVQSGLSGEVAVMPTKLNPVDGAEMIWIPAGNFSMGSASGKSDEMPVHQVTLDGYYIYKNLVTVAMYEKFCAATGRKMPGPPNWGWDNTNYPMVKVTRDDVIAYSQWAGGTLPTEAQWEKAARGTSGSAYPWGDTWNPNNCNAEATLGSPSPVGSFPRGASPYGVLDMAGNVWEWCSDWYDPGYYATSPTDNPPGPPSGTRRVIRGGGWFMDAKLCRSACRLSIKPWDAEDDLGFRLIGGNN
jgi:formylglycine-generating enzyme required for sulfatase activity